MEMPFGRHKGRPISSIPTNYLVWLVENVVFDSEALRAAVEAELSERYRSRRKTPPTAPPPTTATHPKIKAWFRELALRFHPDRCGDDGRAMQILNVAYERLCEILDLPK